MTAPATTPLEVLRAARKLISLPSRWVKRWEAADVDGNQTTATEDDACAFCSLGALLRVTGSVDSFLYDASIARLAHAMYAPGLNRGRIPADVSTPDCAVVSFNDSYFTTHGDVIAAFDDAIQACIADGEGMP